MIDNLHAINGDDIDHLKKRIHEDLEFVFVHLQGLNINAMKNVVQCLSAVDCECLIVVTLAEGANNDARWLGIKDAKSTFTGIANTNPTNFDGTFSKEIPRILVSSVSTEDANDCDTIESSLSKRMAFKVSNYIILLIVYESL